MSGELNAGIVIGILIVIDGRPFADRSTRIPIPIRKPMSRRAECRYRYRYPYRYRWPPVCGPFDQDPDTDKDTDEWGSRMPVSLSVSSSLSMARPG
jgi:hypothetical protein